MYMVLLCCSTWSRTLANFHASSSDSNVFVTTGLVDALTHVRVVGSVTSGELSMTGTYVSMKFTASFMDDTFTVPFRWRTGSMTRWNVSVRILAVADNDEDIWISGCGL